MKELACTMKNRTLNSKCESLLRLHSRSPQPEGGLDMSHLVFAAFFFPFLREIGSALHATVERLYTCEEKVYAKK